MPESESFDAFYARTVWNVTSQMHALADEDGLADHAIREAYARAYQQWYEVSPTGNAETWVLDVAKVAYERRRAEAGGPRGNGGRAPDPGPMTWPGMFRPARPSQPADPEATVAPRPGVAVDPSTAGPSTAGPSTAGPSTAGPSTAGPSTAGPSTAGPSTAGPGTGSPTLGTTAGVFAAGARVTAPAAAADGLRPAAVPPGSLFGSPARGADASSPTADWAGPASATPTMQIADQATPPPTSSRLRARPSGRVLSAALPSSLASRRKLIAAAAAAVILVAGVIVYATGGHGPSHHADPGVSASAVAKPTVHMLPAGRTGGRATIPWSLVGAGWTLAEVSTAQPDANGAATGGGQYGIYLVDPEGGKYRIMTRSGGSPPDLLAWSGDARTALYAVGGAQGSTGASGYGLLTLSSGQLTALTVPAGVTVLGFTRPDGLNLLAIRQNQARDLLERFSLAGAHQATIGSVPRPAGATSVFQGNALSSPDGTTAVWGVSGREMQLVSNIGGLIRRLKVPDTGTSPSCTPISWWTSQTVLAYCNAAGTLNEGRLWLVPVGGSAPTPLTGVSGSASGLGDLTGAWQAGGAVYVTATTATQCSGAASGPGGQQILQLGSGTETAVSVPGSANYHAAVVAGVGRRLLILAETSCPGTSSLIWLNPATHATQTLLTAPATQVGVIDAVPYGSGPTAATNGLN